MKRTKEQIIKEIQKIQKEYFETKNLYWKHSLNGQLWGILFNCNVDWSKDKKMEDAFKKMTDECNPRQLNRMFRLKLMFKRLKRKLW